jgi:speckle-type POZ protein
LDVKITTSFLKKVDVIQMPVQTNFTINKEISNLFEHDSNKDIELNSQDRNTNAHKFILSLRSPVFKAMFESPMFDAKTNSLNFREFVYEPVLEFVRFMYNDAVNETVLSEHAEQLLILANKYDVMNLKIITQNYLLSNNITTDNALDMLMLAITHNAESLKVNCHEIIRRNKAILSADGAFSKIVILGEEIYKELIKEM